MDQPANSDRAQTSAEERLSRLAEAILRINENLDLGNMLQAILDSARDLTGARYSVITLRYAAGWIREFLDSGMTREDIRPLPITIQFDVPPSVLPYRNRPALDGWLVMRPNRPGGFVLSPWLSTHFKPDGPRLPDFLS